MVRVHQFEIVDPLHVDLPRARPHVDDQALEVRVAQGHAEVRRAQVAAVEVLEGLDAALVELDAPLGPHVQRLRDHLVHGQLRDGRALGDGHDGLLVLLLFLLLRRGPLLLAVLLLLGLFAGELVLLLLGLLGRRGVEVVLFGDDEDSAEHGHAVVLVAETQILGAGLAPLLRVVDERAVDELVGHVRDLRPLLARLDGPVAAVEAAEAQEVRGRDVELEEVVVEGHEPRLLLRRRRRLEGHRDHLQRRRRRVRERGLEGRLRGVVVDELLLLLALVAAPERAADLGEHAAPPAPLLPPPLRPRALGEALAARVEDHGLRAARL
mmetsp:Transcript_14168/g.48760  ORF Transcript_14168/g.48760 Transcript_14168/m.48760 type:complete len:324 (+) Transcript_14168:2446-3417(+)